MQINRPLDWEPKKLLRLLRTVWALMLASLVMYAFVAKKLVPTAATAPPNHEFQFGISFTGMAFAIVVLFLRFSRISDLLSQLGSTEFKLLARKIYATYIISFVFAEAVSLFGFVLFVMRGDPEYYLALYLGGVLLMLLCFPRLPIPE